MVLFRRALAGVTGWLLRLLFAASVGAGGYGVYLALFVSLGMPDPDADRQSGLLVMAVAFGASLVAVTALACMPPLRKTVGWVWYLSTYPVFAALLLTTVLPLSGALRLIGDWQRSNTQVTATVSDCYQRNSGDGVDYCTYRWSLDGQPHEQEREAANDYSDGTPVPLWVDPNTGGADDHDKSSIVALFVIVAFGLLADMLAVFGTATMIADQWRGPRAWLADLAWWRTQPSANAGPPTPGTAPETLPEVADAIPPWAAAGAIEDARPGYE